MVRRPRPRQDLASGPAPASPAFPRSRGRCGASCLNGSILGQRSPFADGLSRVRERERARGHPPFHEVVGQAACLDRWIVVAEPRRLGEVAGEDRQPTHGRVGLLAERAVGDEHTLPPQLGSVREMTGLEGVNLVVRHYGGVGGTTQQDERVYVEGIRDVGVAWHRRQDIAPRRCDRSPPSWESPEDARATACAGRDDIAVTRGEPIRLTFLFTDIEGSTRLWEGHPAEMPDALAQHVGILDSAIGDAGGSVIKETGDGVFAVFDRPQSAIDAAVGAQLGLARAAWGVTGPLRARMGIHSGEAVRDHDDYHGPDVNRSARVMATAHGGQVVVSAATYELVAGTVSGITFRDLGEHRLKDLARPERIRQVVHPDLP